MHVEKAIQYMSDVITAAGLTGIADIEKTPARFIKYLDEFCQPLDLHKIFGSTFENRTVNESIIIQTNIPFRMICSHHLLPALGRASVAYIPNQKVIGLSKLTRLVQGVGVEAPSLQEEVTGRIAYLLWNNLDAKGAIVNISAEHTCMASRGVNRDRVQTVTREARGIFTASAELRKEFYTLCQKSTTGG